MRFLSTLVAGLRTVSARSPTQAQFRLGGLEYFTWSEDTNLSVGQTGPLLPLQLGYVQPNERGLEVPVPHLGERALHRFGLRQEPHSSAR